MRIVGNATDETRRLTRIRSVTVYNDELGTCHMHTLSTHFSGAGRWSRFSTIAKTDAGEVRAIETERGWTLRAMDREDEVLAHALYRLLVHLGEDVRKPTLSRGSWRIDRAERLTVFPSPIGPVRAVTGG